MLLASCAVKKVFSRILLPLALVAILGGTTASAFDYDSDNGAATVLFQMGGSARGQGMGGAYASLARGSESAYWNPGGLAYQKNRFEIQVSPRFFQSVDYELGDDERSYLMAQGGMRFGKFAIAGSYLRHEIGDILFNDGSTEVSDQNVFSYQQTGLILAAGGLFLRDHLGVGLAIRSLSASFADLPGTYTNPRSEDSGSGVGFQLGATYRVNEDLAAAIVYDLPSEMDWGTAEPDPSGSRVQTGASYRYLLSPNLYLVMAGQLENIGGTWARVHLGGEVTAFDKISIRAGYKNLHLQSSTMDPGDLNEASALTLGIGSADVKLLSQCAVRLDLSVDWQDFNSQTVTTLVVGF